MNKQAGVTLMELMITVAVIGILAGIAYPSYQSQMQRSRRADAKVGLERLAQTMERCYSNNLPMTYAGCGVASMTSENGYYTISRTSADANGFTLTATAQGAQLKDTDCRTFTLTNSAAGTAVDSGGGDKTAVCWKR